MLRVPFLAWVIGVTALVTMGAWTLRPGSPEIAISTGMGAAVAGLFAAAAVFLLNRIRAKSRAGGASTPAEAIAVQTKLTAGFASLMLARMVGYGAFVTALYLTGAGNPVAACAGLALGTLIFQVLEIIYIRSLKLELPQ